MLNFIIGEDNTKFSARTVQIIDSFMMNYDIEYKAQCFENYGKDFMKAARESGGFKIYILDLKTEKGSGLDAARMIREELDDWVSIIIVVTSYTEYKYEALGNRLYLLDFISKFDDCEKRIKECLEIALKNYDNRHKALSFSYSHIMKKIEYRNIVNIEKEQDSKRCIINTTYGEHYMNETLNNIYAQLDERFIKVNRSLIVNSDFIREYDAKSNKISFSNGTYTHLISKSGRKELMKYVGSRN